MHHQKLLLAILLALPAAASAGTYGTAGRGLGAVVFGDKKGMIQIVAATLNGTGVQTFGITSGTSECTDKSKNAMLDQESFIRTNFASVMRDAAAGQGEYVSTLATLLGCNEAVHPEFFSLLQREHGQLFSSTDQNTVLSNVKKAAAENQQLRTACGRI